MRAMMNPDDLRPPGQDPDEFKEDLREAALVLGLHYTRLYQKAGCPFGPSVEAMLLWMRDGCQSRSN